jgi:hypothetical protein
VLGTFDDRLQHRLIEVERPPVFFTRDRPERDEERCVIVFSWTSGLARRRE